MRILDRGRLINIVGIEYYWVLLFMSVVTSESRYWAVFLESRCTRCQQLSSPFFVTV